MSRLANKMRFAWFILIYCFLAKATGVLALTVSPTAATDSNQPNNQTEIVIVIPADNESGSNRTNGSETKTSTVSSTTINSTSAPTHLVDSVIRPRQSKLASSDDVMAAQPSTATLTTLPAGQVKYNRNREIRTDIVHKSIPIQRGIIKSRPLAGVKSSSFQFSRQVKDIKSSPLEELQTERTTVVASTRPAPESATAAIGSQNASQLATKQTTPSLPITSSTVNSEATDQLVRRSSLGKTNPKSGKTNEARGSSGKTSPAKSGGSTKNLFNRNDQYDRQEHYADQQQENNNQRTPDDEAKQDGAPIGMDEQQARHPLPSDEQQPSNRDICDFCLYEGEGNFTSYNFPLPYGPNLNCSFKILRVDEFETCALEIYFHEFDVPIDPGATSALVSGNKNMIDETASSECKGDYLEILGRRFCGNGWMNKMETIPFAPEQTELTFKFRSDHRGAGKGFWIEVRRKLGSCYGRTPPIKKCEKRFSEMRFAMTSPQFGASAYRNNINCAYFVRKATPDVCGLELKFTHFDIEPVNGCYYDFFEVEGEKLCGTMRSNTIKRLKFAPEIDQKQFNFHTDKQVGRTGFKIEVAQLTNCDSIFEDENDPANNAKLQEQLPPPPSCNVCTSDKDGVLVSYGYPHYNYRNNLLCSYRIDRKDESYCYLQLFFEDFNVAPSVNCEEDYLLIGEEKFCGTTLHSTRKMIPFRTNNRMEATKTAESPFPDGFSANTSIQMMFHTNQATTSKGFMIRFNQVKCNALEEEMDEKGKISNDISGDNDVARYSGQRDQEKGNQQQTDAMSGYSTTPMPPFHCEHHYNSKYFTLVSPNVSNESGEMVNGQTAMTYPHNLACDYRITQNSSQVCYLELTFKTFDVEASGQCQFDYLEVNNVRLCGTLQRPTTRTYIFNTMNKVIRFRTDGSTSRSGFVIGVEQLECNGDAIIRPNLPTLNNITHHGGDTKTPSMNTPMDNAGLTKGGSMYPGVQMKDRGQGNNTKSDLCAMTYGEEEFDIFSPQFPLNYPLNSNCVYTIQRFSPMVCKLEINFMQFNIENSKAGVCSADYLDVMGIKLCGSLGSNTVRQFPFPMDRNYVNVVFSANALRSENDFGFYLKVKQMNCPSSGGGGDQISQLNNNLLPPYVQQEQPSDYPSNPLFLDSTLTGNCNEMHNEMTFQLKSPSFPSNYIRNLNCMYKIIKAKSNVCQLEVNVVEFNVQPNLSPGPSSSLVASQDCGNEYVDFNGEQICGRVAPRVVRFFPFGSSEFLIRFKSGYSDQDLNSNGDRAFMLQIRQLECPYLTPNQMMPGDLNQPGGGTKAGKTPAVHVQNSFEKKKQIEVCDQQFDSAEFEIKYAVQMTKGGSMGSEMNRTRNCMYTIRKHMPSVCAIEFTFYEFIISEQNSAEMIKSGVRPLMSNCETNFLRLTETEKLCSNIPNVMVKKVPFNEEIKNLQLHLSLPYASPKRVYIRVKQIDCLPNENSITPNPNLSPNMNPNLNPNLNQQQVIAQSPSINPTMHSPAIAINQSPSQQLPEMYNNNDSFRQPNINQIDYMHQLPPPSICELCYTELSGEIKSYNYPAAYPRDLNCTMKVTGQPGFCGVYLRFDVFTINNAETRTAPTPCVDDYLELNGVKYCGKQLENVKKILAFDSNPKELSFRFVSKRHTIGNGFKLNYMQIPCYLTPGQQSILSAMMTDTPLTGSNPKFSLPNSPGMSKNSDFSQENQVQENDMTSPDYQAFYTSAADPNEMQQTQQQPLPHSTKSAAASNSSASLKDGSSSAAASTNDLTQAQSMHTVPRLPCDQAIYSRFFEIRSVNWPFAYPPNSDCLYSIRRLSSSICKLRLYFADFELENAHNFKLIKDNHSLQRNLLHQTDGCNEDYLEIAEKLRFCGAQLNGTLRDFDFTSSYKFPLRFKSNEEGSARGFLIRGEQIECIPSSVMFPNLNNKAAANQLQSSDSTLSYKLNGSNKIPGLDQIAFYNAPPVRHNSTSYSSTSSATFRSPVQTSSTNSSSSSQQSSSTAQSNSLNNSESQAFLSPNSAYQPPGAGSSPFQWSIPNAPYMISIKGQQVSISGEHPNTYYHTNENGSLPREGNTQTHKKTSLSVNGAASTDQPIASDSQQHTSSSTSQYNCNQVISDPIFEVTSPYYPYRYDSNTRCLITIQKFKRSVCHLDLVFIKFDLGATADCDSYTDYLSINGERFCGHYYHNRSLHFSMPDDVAKAVRIRTFRFDGPTLQMRFNGQIGTGYGFYLRGRQVECAVVGKNYLGRILPINEFNDHHHDSLHPSVVDHHHSDEHSSDEHHSGEHDHSTEHHHDDAHLDDKHHHSDHRHSGDPHHSDHRHSSDPHHSDHRHAGDPHHPDHRHPPEDRHHLDDAHHLTPIDHHHAKPLDLPPYHYHPDHLTHHVDPKTNHTVRLHLDHKVLQHQDLNNTTNYFNYPPHVDLHHLTHNYQTNKHQQANHTTNNLARHHHLENHYNTHNYHTNSQANHDSRYNVSNYLINSDRLVGVPRSLTALSHCDQIFKTNDIRIQSPNHPSNYPNNVYCRYVIQRPNNLTCAIDLTFMSFNLEEEDRCSKDYFEIDGARICGSLPPYHQRRYYYFANESEKVFTFRSDLFISNSGFSIVGQQISNCNSYTSRTDNSPIKCDVQTDSVKGELISRNYPAPYDANTQCTYKIKAADQRFCRLNLRIRDFDIRSNANCDDDYLYIDGERLCNANLRKSEMTLYFPENGLARELQFNFYSNSVESGRGFYIEYLQELCIGGNEKTYQTGVGHAYPSAKSNDDQFSQARSMHASNNQASDGNQIVGADDPGRDPSIQQTISLREQQAGVYKKQPPTYPPNYVAKSNPVGEMIEAIDRNSDVNSPSSGDHQTSYPKSYQSKQNTSGNLNYPTTAYSGGSSRSSPLFDGRKSQSRTGKQQSDYADYNGDDRYGDSRTNDSRNSDRSGDRSSDRTSDRMNDRTSDRFGDSKQSDQSKANWSGNIQLVKPTVSGSAVASFMNKLKMGDQVTTSVKGRYEVIENRSSSSKTPSEVKV